jgi:transcriptional regulator with XRE-family HTH domain
MFKENFVRLCNSRGEFPSVVCKKIGISPAAFSQWTSETVPRQSTLVKIADYFGVSVSYLLGVVDDPDPVSLVDPSKKEPPMLDAIEALLQDMTEEELEDVRKYAEFLASKNKK